MRVGSANERPEEAGLAHVLEHMLFKGTAKRGVGEIARDVEDAGGDINAWTSHDETVYHLIVPAHEAARGLDILADAVLHAALDADELARELDVILEEIKRGDDSPQRLLSDELFKSVFTRHPYKNSVLGTVESVSGTTREILHAFYSRHYTPANITIVVVGDVRGGRDEPSPPAKPSGPGKARPCRTAPSPPSPCKRPRAWSSSAPPSSRPIFPCACPP